MGVIIGPGLIGFLSEYATYAYALRIGIRPPLEGIPYLSATVTAGSLFIALSAAVVFILARMAAVRIAWQIITLFRDISARTNKIAAFFELIFSMKIAKTEHEELIGKIKSISTKNALILSLVVSLAVGLIFYLIDTYIATSNRSNSVEVAISVSVLSFVAFLTLWRESAIWWVAIGASIFFYALSFYFIFSIAHYSTFLRIVGYGGGAKVTVETIVNVGKINSSEYYLLLRTSESLITLDRDKVTVIEIPISTISNINYELGSQYRDYVDVQKIANKSIQPSANASAD
jgi:hypothetical protein